MYASIRYGHNPKRKRILDENSGIFSGLHIEIGVIKFPPEIRRLLLYSARLIVSTGCIERDGKVVEILGKSSTVQLRILLEELSSKLHGLLMRRELFTVLSGISRRYSVIIEMLSQFNKQGVRMEWEFDKAGKGGYE